MCRKKKECEQRSQCACAQDGGCGGDHEGSPGHGGDDTWGTTSEDFTLRVEDVQQLQIPRKGLLVDTGSSSHIINDRSRFKNFDSTFKPERHSMEMADGKRTFGLAQGRGDAQVCLIAQGVGVQ